VPLVRGAAAGEARLTAFLGARDRLGALLDRLR